MDKSLILRKLIEYYSDGNGSKFARLLGVKPQTISTWLARNTYDIELIFAKCYNINPFFLLTGEGEMLLEQPSCNRKNGDLYSIAENQLIDDNAEINGNLAEYRKDDNANIIKSFIKVVDEISEQRKLVETSQQQITKSQEQIDRLLSIIEHSQGNDEPKHDDTICIGLG